MFAATWPVLRRLTPNPALCDGAVIPSALSSRSPSYELRGANYNWTLYRWTAVTEETAGRVSVVAAELVTPHPRAAIELRTQLRTTS